MSLLSEPSVPDDAGLGITSAEDIALTHFSIDLADIGLVGTVKINTISRINRSTAEM